MRCLGRTGCRIRASSTSSDGWAASSTRARPIALPSNARIADPMDTVILSAARTPLGSFQGSLAAVPAPRLGAVAIAGALARARAAPDAVTDVIMGHVLQAGVGQAPARQAAIHAGVRASARCV